MSLHSRWRTARFNSREERAEFVVHAKSIGLEGLDVEMLDDDVRVRFRAPAKFEIGLAGMVDAHGGKVLPSVDQVEPQVVKSV